MPSASAVRRSSSPEQSMPLLTTPIFSVRSIRRSPGRTAPGSATGTRWPGAMFVAPHTISSGSPLPERDRSSATGGRRAGGFSTVSSSPTTTFCQSAPQRSMPLTSMPEQGQPLGQLLRRELDVDVVAQPGQRDSHRHLTELLQEAQVVLQIQAQVGLTRSGGAGWRSARRPSRTRSPGSAPGRGRRTGARPGGPCPAPRIVIQPLRQQAGQPDPPHTTHSTSNATDGSVNG